MLRGALHVSKSKLSFVLERNQNKNKKRKELGTIFLTLVDFLCLDIVVNNAQPLGGYLCIKLSYQLHFH